MSPVLWAGLGGLGTTVAAGIAALVYMLQRNAARSDRDLWKTRSQSHAAQRDEMETRLKSSEALRHDSAERFHALLQERDAQLLTLRTQLANASPPGATRERLLSRGEGEETRHGGGPVGNLPNNRPTEGT